MPGTDRLCLVVFSGAFDRVHYALAMAAAALASARPTTLFFTMGGIRALLAERNGVPGWHELGPGENGLPPDQADAALEQAGAAGFEELLAAVAALGGTFMVCEMGLAAIGHKLADLRSDPVISPGGLTTFLAGVKDGAAVVFV